MLFSFVSGICICIQTHARAYEKDTHTHTAGWLADSIVSHRKNCLLSLFDSLLSTVRVYCIKYFIRNSLSTALCLSRCCTVCAVFYAIRILFFPFYSRVFDTRTHHWRVYNKNDDYNDDDVVVFVRHMYAELTLSITRPERERERESKKAYSAHEAKWSDGW